MVIRRGTSRRLGWGLAVAASLVACDQLFDIEQRSLESAADGGTEASLVDSGVGDSNGADSGRADSGHADTGSADAGHEDTGVVDSAGPGDGSGDGPADGSGDAATCPDAGPQTTIYVNATTGSDGNQGCKSAPKQTILGAYTAAQTTGATTIKVCKGTYAEMGLRVISEVSLLGGYDCSTWLQR